MEDGTEPMEDGSESMEDRNEVLDYLGKRFNKAGELEVRIHWANYSAEEATWESRDDIFDDGLKARLPGLRWEGIKEEPRDPDEEGRSREVYEVDLTGEDSQGEEQMELASVESDG